MSNRFCNETPLSLFRVSSSLLIEPRSSIDRSPGLARLDAGVYRACAEFEHGNTRNTVLGGRRGFEGKELLFNRGKQWRERYSKESTGGIIVREGSIGSLLLPLRI